MVSAYLTYLCNGIDFSLKNCANLFNKWELEELSRCLKLSECATELLCRITLRKHVWLKSVSFQSYIYNNHDIDVIANVLSELRDHYMIEYIDGRTPFESVWEAVIACFSVDDLIAIDRVLTNNKTKVQGKMNNLNHIYKTITSQKTVFGAPLSERVAKIVCDYLKKTASVPQLHMIVRVNPSLLELLRRCQRLYQISSSAQAAFSPSATGTISMSQPIEHNTPLLVAFDKLRFAPYVVADSCVCVDTGDGTATGGAVTSVIFLTKRHFHQWEAGTELRYTIEMIGLQSSANAFNKYRHAALAKNIHKNMTTALVNFNCDHFSHSYLNHHTALASLMLSADHLLPISTVECDCAAVDVVMQKLSTTLQLLAPLCLVAYTVEHAGESTRQREDYWIKFDAGTQLAYQCCETAAHYEKEVTRDYILAIYVYELLLALPFLPHRRGSWCKRLSMDFDHLKRPRCALRAAYRGLLDPLVLISDKTELVVRIKALTAKIERAAERAKGSTPVCWEVGADFEHCSGPDESQIHLQRLNAMPIVPQECLFALVVSTVVAKLTTVAAFAGESTSSAESGSSSDMSGEVKIDDVKKETATDLRGVNSRSSSGSNSSSSNARKASKSPSSPVIPVHAHTAAVPHSTTWACTVCTYINTRYHSSSGAESDSCEVCATVRQVLTTQIITRNTADTFKSPYKQQSHAQSSIISSINPTSSIEAKRLSSGAAGDSQCTAIEILSSDDEQEQEEDDMMEVILVNEAVMDVRTEAKEAAATVDAALMGLNCCDILRRHADDMSEWKNNSITGDKLAGLNLFACHSSTATAACTGESDVFPQRLLSSLGISAPPPIHAAKRGTDSAHSLQSHIDSIIATATLDAFPPPLTFTVHGRRFGDTSRKGKSKFCGADGDLVSVEGFVLQKCFEVSQDDLNNVTRANTVSAGENDSDGSKSVESSADRCNVGSGVDNGASTIYERCMLMEEEADEVMFIDCASETASLPVPDSSSKQASIKAASTKAASSSTEKVKRTKKPPAEIDLSSYLSVVDGGGWQGWHCEGSHLKTLFGLLFWDILFADRTRAGRGATVFVTAYQDSPLDLGYASFITNRRDEIFQRLDEIRAFTLSDILQTLSASYRAHFGQICRGVSWAYSLSIIQLIAVCMGAKGLAAVCRGCAVDYKQVSGGAPDLLLIRVSRSIQPDANLESGAESRRVFVGLSELVGADWSRLGEFREDSAAAATSDLTSLLKESAPGVRSSGSEDKAVTEKVGLFAARKKQRLSAESVVTSEIDGLAAECSFVSTVSECSDNIVTVESDSEEDVEPAVTTDHSDAYTYTGPDLDLSALYRSSDGADSDSDASLESLLQGVTFETLFVEVKGPGDHLAYRQLLWLHLLSRETADHDMRAALCHVKE